MTLDSNILIAYFQGEQAVINKLNELRHQDTVFFISTIVEAEVLSFSHLSTSERSLIESFFEENTISIPVDRTIAHTAARLRAAYPRLKLPDALIASTALNTRTSLMTRNLKDFRKITHLRLMTV